MPGAVRQAIIAAGDGRIDEVYVCREEIVGALKATVEVLSMTRLPRHTFHVYQVLKIGKAFYRIDKNERVVVQIDEHSPLEDYNKKATWTTSLPWVAAAGITAAAMTQNFCRQFSLPKLTTLREYFAKANRKHEPKSEPFWQYDAMTANCQLFVLWCLTGNDVQLSDEDKAWIYQGITLPKYTTRIFRVITDVASKGKQAVFGAHGPLESRYGPSHEDMDEIERIGAARRFAATARDRQTRRGDQLTWVRHR